MISQAATPRKVSCPTCGKVIEWVAENRYRPFCSERCKLIDLGAWSADDYRIPESAQESREADPN